MGAGNGNGGNLGDAPVDLPVTYGGGVSVTVSRPSPGLGGAAPSPGDGAGMAPNPGGGASLGAGSGGGVKHTNPPPLPEGFIGPPTAGQGRVPLSPPGASVNRNLQEAEIQRWMDHNNPMALYSWFYNKVRNGGPWDYKQKGRQYADFGNFNFGAAGAAAGIPLTTSCARRDALKLRLELPDRDGGIRDGKGTPGEELPPMAMTQPTRR